MQDEICASENHGKIRNKGLTNFSSALWNFCGRPFGTAFSLDDLCVAKGVFRTVSHDTRLRLYARGVQWSKRGFRALGFVPEPPWFTQPPVYASAAAVR